MGNALQRKRGQATTLADAQPNAGDSAIASRVQTRNGRNDPPALMMPGRDTAASSGDGTLGNGAYQ